MVKAKQVELGYVVKEPLTGMFVDDDFQLVHLGRAEQFFHRVDAENFRHMASGRIRHGSLTVVEVRTTLEEV